MSDYKSIEGNCYKCGKEVDSDCWLDSKGRLECHECAGTEPLPSHVGKRAVEKE